MSLIRQRPLNANMHCANETVAVAIGCYSSAQYMLQIDTLAVVEITLCVVYISIASQHRPYCALDLKLLVGRRNLPMLVDKIKILPDRFDVPLYLC